MSPAICSDNPIAAFVESRGLVAGVTSRSRDELLAEYAAWCEETQERYPLGCEALLRRLEIGGFLAARRRFSK